MSSTACYCFKTTYPRNHIRPDKFSWLPNNRLHIFFEWREFLLCDTSVCHVSPSCLSVTFVRHVCPSRLSIRSLHHIFLSRLSITSVCHVYLSLVHNVRPSHPSVMSVHHFCPSHLSVTSIKWNLNIISKNLESREKNCFYNTYVSIYLSKYLSTACFVVSELLTLYDQGFNLHKLLNWFNQ